MSFERRWLRTNRMLLEPLVQNTIRKIRTEDLDGQEYANVAHGAACSINGDSLDRLYFVLARGSEHRLGHFNT